METNKIPSKKQQKKVLETSLEKDLKDMEQLMMKSMEGFYNKRAEEIAAKPRPKNKHLPEKFSEGFIRRMTEPLSFMPIEEPVTAPAAAGGGK
jgi:hypothetical protein